MRKLSYFNLKLEAYLLQTHPDKIKDIDFINSRSEAAEQEFEKCSREGMYITECKERANTVMFQDLHYSLYCKIKNIIEEQEFANLEASEIYNKYKDQLNEKYQLIDSFSGSPEETELENEIITLIKTDNGIQ